MEYTIEITQYCPNECGYCSSDATPDGKHLPLKVILEFLDGNNIGPGDRVNISGGEPLAHPDFYKILTECQKRTSNVWVYTNAIRQIKYNPHVVTDGIKIEANLCLAEGCFARPFTVPKGVRVNFLKFIPVGRGQVSIYCYRRTERPLRHPAKNVTGGITMEYKRLTTR